MLHTILMTVPPENVKKTEDFFYLMTEKMEDVRDDADSLLNEYKRFSDSQYWEVEKHFDDDEAKKIFDELMRNRLNGRTVFRRYRNQLFCHRW